MEYKIIEDRQLEIKLNQEKSIFMSADRLSHLVGDVDIKTNADVSVKNIISSISGKNFVFNTIKAVKDSVITFSSNFFEKIHYIEVTEEQVVNLKPSSFFGFYGDFKFTNELNISKLISGDSVVMLKITGNGILFFTSNEGYDEIELSQSSVLVEESHILMYQGDLQLKAKTFGIKSMFLSDEGYLIDFEGNGKVFVNRCKKIKFTK